LVYDIHMVQIHMGQPVYAYEDAADLELSAPWERAIDTASHGQVAWLTEHHQRVFALLPAELAAAALDALDDAGDRAALAAARARRAAGERGIPLEHIEAEIAADERAMQV